MPAKKTYKKQLRLGIVGVGNQGTMYSKFLLAGKVRRCKLVAICDTDPKALDKIEAPVSRFKSMQAMLKSGEVNAVVITTPHYDHVPLAIKALKAGMHVLVDKPMSVQKSECKRLISEAEKHKKQVFSLMFNQRTDPAYQTIKKMMESGQLGELVRVNWIITNWFRSDAYYASGGWRATWAGEGGGVLVNQCPHQLDLLQWICGMPTKIMAHCSLGKSHDIEVEDEVTAYLEFKNKATGVFITSTGEAPGTNRLEIAGDKAKVVVEDGKIKIWKNTIPTSRFCRTTKKKFASPKRTYREIEIKGNGKQHQGIFQNFTDAVLDGKPLLAPGEEGINNVELANAMQYSGLKGEAVSLPMKTTAYNKMLKELIAHSKTA